MVTGRLVAQPVKTIARQSKYRIWYFRVSLSPRCRYRHAGRFSSLDRGCADDIMVAGTN